MRVIGWLLVVVSLACTPHGLRARKAEGDPGSAATAAVNGVCSPADRPAVPRALDPARLLGSDASETVILSTTGYNYVSSPGPSPRGSVPAAPRP